MSFRNHTLFMGCVLASLSAQADLMAQPGGGPGPGGILNPLPNVPPTPVVNPTTPTKALLGKALFWDEQLSSSGTVSCGTCHIPSTGGSDPRTLLPGSVHPGGDGLFGTPDDVHGSKGRILTQPDLYYLADDSFGLSPRVTSRKTPTMINAAFFNLLFWDGRATSNFQDPIDGSNVILNNGALESQAAAPPVSDIEMAHMGETWTGVASRITAAKPLALASELPAALLAFVDGRTYPELFQLAFGSSQVTASRISMAIATYQRTLVSNQSPFDAFAAGVPGSLTPQQQQGFQIFTNQGRCATCHGTPLLSNGSFRNIGVTPISADLGRGAITGNPNDNGRFKVPTLRNVSLRAPYFHNGSAASLADVVDFYDRGGDFFVNQDPLIAPIGLNPQQKGALVAFLQSFTDPRVAAGVAPFDRPKLFTESSRVPQLFGHSSSTKGNGGPSAIAEEPPILGNANFTLGLTDASPGAITMLGVDIASSIAGIPAAGIQLHVGASPAFILLPIGIVNDDGGGNGFTSASLPLPAASPLAAGVPVFFQWITIHPDGEIAASEGIEVTLF